MAAEHCLPLLASQFAAVMTPLAPWPESRRVAVAVSGGADSLCLAFLAAGWGSPIGLIVNHDLRPESAAEAAATLAVLAAMGVPGRVLTVVGLAHGPGLAARARAARYSVLIEAAREAGCIDLLLGHHSRDQAETLLMRRWASSGLAGLAAMAPVVDLADLRLVRPLLGLPPGRLRATLRSAGFAWVEDPSNSNPAALRSRLRAQLNDPGGNGPEVAALVSEAACHAAARRAQDAETAAILAARVTIRPEGFALLSPGKLPVAALTSLVRTISGSAYPAPTTSLARLAANPLPAVLGGVRFLPAGRMGPGLLVVREVAAMSPPVPALPFAIWDQRFRLRTQAPLPPGAALGALGVQAAALRHLSHLPAAVLQTLPAIRVQGALAAVPHIGYHIPELSEGVLAEFSPAHPLAGAPFGVAAGGCQGQREPPC